MLEALINQLHFSLDNVEARPRIAFPLENSGLDITIHLGIDNPTSNQIWPQSLLGNLEIVQDGKAHALGRVAHQSATSIPARGRGTLAVSLSFRYADVVNAWQPISNVALGRPTTWKLNGNLGISLGPGSNSRSLSVPVNLSKTTGNR
jgi:hypothetical protein